MNGRWGGGGAACCVCPGWDGVWPGVIPYTGAAACCICGLYPGCAYIPIIGCWAYMPIRIEEDTFTGISIEIQ